jgi:hypothetical protein
MPSGGAHCTVLSKHCTSGERSTDRESRSGSGSDEDDINGERLDDSDWQIV